MKDDIITKLPLLGLSNSGSFNFCSSVPDLYNREQATPAPFVSMREMTNIFRSNTRILSVTLYGYVCFCYWI
ncbi:hypothetical protein Peur_033888 [Populus x canadensis]